MNKAEMAPETRWNEDNHQIHDEMLEKVAGGTQPKEECYVDFLGGLCHFGISGNKTSGDTEAEKQPPTGGISVDPLNGFCPGIAPLKK